MCEILKEINSRLYLILLLSILLYSTKIGYMNKLRRQLMKRRFLTVNIPLRFIVNVYVHAPARVIVSKHICTRRERELL